MKTVHISKTQCGNNIFWIHPVLNDDVTKDYVHELLDETNEIGTTFETVFNAVRLWCYFKQQSVKLVVHLSEDVCHATIIDELGGIDDWTYVDKVFSFTEQFYVTMAKSRKEKL